MFYSLFCSIDGDGDGDGGDEHRRKTLCLINGFAVTSVSIGTTALAGYEMWKRHKEVDLLMSIHSQLDLHLG